MDEVGLREYGAPHTPPGAEPGSSLQRRGRRITVKLGLEGAKPPPLGGRDENPAESDRGVPGLRLGGNRARSGTRLLSPGRSEAAACEWAGRAGLGGLEREVEGYTESLSELLSGEGHVCS